MIIVKFGGTSVGTAERMKKLVPLITHQDDVIVVLSAMHGTTNALVEIATALFGDENERATDLINSLEKKYNHTASLLFSKEDFQDKASQMLTGHFSFIRSFTLDVFTANEEKAILAQGELIATGLFQLFLEEAGVKSALLPALNFMRIDEDEEPDMDFIKSNLLSELKTQSGRGVFITQGFICRNSFGEIDNLKRGGSDYTATLIGAALGANEIQIWTDIDGMHNNDPRVVDRTFPVTHLSFDEAAELAYFGAKILHPTCVLPAQKANVPVRLLNTMDPTAPGTIIRDEVNNDRITAIAAKDGIIAIKIKSERMLLAYGFLRSVFEIFERYKTPIDMITTSEVAVSLTIDKDKNLAAIVNELQNFCVVEVDRDLTIVCIVGSFSEEKQGYASMIFECLKHIPIRMISYGGSRNNISVLLNTGNKKPALMALNQGLFNL